MMVVVEVVSVVVVEVGHCRHPLELVVDCAECVLANDLPLKGHYFSGSHAQFETQFPCLPVQSV